MSRNYHALDFDHICDEWESAWQEQDSIAQTEEMARIESDAEIADYRLNGYGE